MTASPIAQRIAEELAALTESQPHLSEFMRNFAEACGRDIEEAAPLYQSLQLWGGMGSFADQAGVDLDPADAAHMNDLIIGLFEEFERQGVHYARASGWTNAFRQWRDMDIFRASGS